MRLGIFISTALAAFGQSKPIGLPAGAVVIEKQQVKPGRTIALWMINPEKLEMDPSDPLYTCPDFTRGNHYSGPTRVSLIDEPSGKIINTVRVTSNPDDDRFDIPFLIERRYYTVPQLTQGKQGRPRILSLEDLNGDGKPLEFVFYDAIACMGLSTALFGYSERQDKVIQYPVDLTSLNGLRRADRVELWPDYLFEKKPIAPGKWKFSIDYSGRGGCIDSYEVSYSPSAERFAATLTSSDCAGEK